MTIETQPLTRQKVLQLDDADPLAHCRERFDIPDGLLYFDGNSLGPLPHASQQRLREVTEQQWGQDLIRSWNTHRWIDLPRHTGAKIARLIGARDDEVIAADSTSVNLFKLLDAACGLRPDRRVILTLADDFPTDRYIAASVAERRGLELRAVPPPGLEAALGPSVAVLVASHVDYKTSAMLDLDRLTRRAHDVGALTLWDLSHSAGAVDLDLGRAGADLAIGCGYKYLNGGPGAPAFAFVRRELQTALETPLPGWLGHAEPFAFASAYEPGPGVDRLLCGTPPILSLASLDAALEAFDGVDLGEVRRKSMALGSLFLDRLENTWADHGLQLASPDGAQQRGSHLALRHPQGFAVMQALIERRVIGDFRPPDLMRFGFAPLYHRYADVWDAVETLRDILSSGVFHEPRYAVRGTVT